MFFCDMYTCINNAIKIILSKLLHIQSICGCQDPINSDNHNFTIK